MSFYKFLNSNAFVFILCSLAILACIVLISSAFESTMDHIEWTEVEHIVESGDSIWALSYKYCPEGVSRREYVYEIEQLNGTNGLIHPGQTLRMLVPVE